MSLRTMVDFKPDETDMAMLDLDVVVYVKATIVSIEKEVNYGFVRYMFAGAMFEEVVSTFKEVNKTIFYDFNHKDERAMTIFELYSTQPYMHTSSLLQDILEGYDHAADVIFDIYTHDDHEYRLSNINGIVVNDKLR